MKIFQEGNKFRIESDFLDSGILYCRAVDSNENFLVTADENNNVSAWNIQTGEPVSSLEEIFLLKCAESGWSVLVSEDMKAVRRIPAERIKMMLTDAGRMLVFVLSGKGLFKNDVYYLDENHASWEKAASGLEALYTISSSFIGNVVKNGRLRKVFRTISGHSLELPPSAEIKRFHRLSEQIVVLENGSYICYDVKNGKELFRSSQHPECEEADGKVCWYSDEFYYYAGKIHRIPGYIPHRTRTGWRFGGYLHIQDRRDSCRLLDIRTGTVSDCYSDIVPAGQNFLVQKNREIGLLNRNAELILPPEYDNIRYISKNDTYLLEKDGRFGRADRNGTMISLVVWDWMSPYDKGNSDCIFLKLGNQIAFMTSKGFLSCEPFYGEAVFGVNKNVLCCWKYPDKEKKEKPSLYCFNLYTGETVLEGDFDDVRRLRQGCILVQKGGLSGVFDTVRKEFLSEMAFCHVSEERNNICIYFPETGETKLYQF